MLTATVVVSGNSVTGCDDHRRWFRTTLLATSVRLPDFCHRWSSAVPCSDLTTVDTTTAFPAVYAIVVDANTLQFASSEANAEAGVALDIQDAGTDSTIVKTPLGAAAQGIITTGGDAMVFSAGHGLKTAERVMFDGDIDTATTRLFKGTSEHCYHHVLREGCGPELLHADTFCFQPGC